MPHHGGGMGLFHAKSKKKKAEIVFSTSEETPREKALRYGTLSLVGSGCSFWIMIAGLAMVPQGAAIFIFLAVVGSLSTASLFSFSCLNFFKAMQPEPLVTQNLNQDFLAIN